MGIINAIEKRAAMTGATDDKWYSPGGFFYGGVGTSTKTGTSVSEYNAMQLAVVWCCIKVLSEDMASLPLHLYKRRKSGGKDKATADDRYYLLHDKPNPEMTAMSFREAYASHLLSWGNGYAEKQLRGSLGKLEALWPITPNRVTVYRNEKKQLRYEIQMTMGNKVDLPRRQILHTPGLSYNGLIGYSPIAAAREAIGLGMALEEFGELYFGNGTHPGVVISHPGQLSPQAHSNLGTSLADAHSGLGKTHRLMLLEEGMKIEKIGIPNDEAQFLESRKFQNVDIGSRIYRLAPQQYGEYDKASTYASSEQFALDYVTKTLRAWLVRLEQSYNFSLLDDSERDEYFFEHNVEGMLRGDIASRYSSYSIAKASRLLTTNEIRELENRNPIDGGDVLDITPNMVPVNTTQPTKKEQKSFNTYSVRLSSAYKDVFRDAAERILRKETKRLKWGMEKHGLSGFPAFADEFYKELPEFIKKQITPAFLSLSNAILGMENELNGLNLNGNRPDFDKFIAKQAEIYAENHVKNSLSELISAVKNGKFEEKIDEWESERASEIAANQALSLTDNIKDYLKTMQ